jgi:hypothetical protein
MKRQVRFGVGHTILYPIYRRGKEIINRKKVQKNEKNQKIRKFFD